jgi:hypothetical protein
LQAHSCILRVLDLVARDGCALGGGPKGPHFFEQLLNEVET